MPCLDSIVEKTKSNFWLDEVDFLIKEKTNYSPSIKEAKSDLKKILSELESMLFSNKRGRALNWAVLGLVYFHDSFLEKIRRNGLLRPSRHSINYQTVRFVVDQLVSSNNSNFHSSTSKEYFKSVSCLYRLWPEVNKYRMHLINMLTEGKEQTFKGILVALDYLFMIQHQGDKQKPSSEVGFFSIEALADGFSYLYFLYSEHLGEPRYSISLDYNLIIDNTYLSLLIIATHIRKFQEIEIMVDILNFDVSVDRTNKKFVAYSPDSELDKAHRLGYILTNMQNTVHSISNKDSEMLSLENCGDELCNILGDKYITLLEKPMPRYVFSLPPLEIFEELIKNKTTLFHEEAMALSAASKDFNVEIETLLDFKLTPHINVLDLIRTQRLINLIRWYIAKYLRPKLDSSPELVFQSLVPSFEASKLEELLEAAVDKEKVQSLINFLTWDLSNKTVFDVQYQPLVKTKLGTLIPMNAFASSNILRNSLFISQKRLYENGTDDPLAPLLAKELKIHTTYVQENLKYNYSGQIGEVDVAALYNGYLFVFECKNSLLPCSPYEIRTSYDYVLTASKQLEKFKVLFGHLDFRQYLEQTTGWNISDTVKIVTCIIMGNRMFTGLRLNGHPVRSSYELAQFIKEGIIVLNDEKKCFWRSKEFTSSDLYKYIEEDLLHKPMFESMEQYSEKYTFGKSTLEYQSYCLNILSLAKKLGFKEPKPIE